MTNKTEREDLVDQANELGLEFAPNIGDKKLKELINAELGQENDKVAIQTHLTPLQKRNIKAAERKKAALKTKVVTITNRDARESGIANSVHLSFENTFFGLAKNVPLDVPVELEVALITIAEKTLMTLHKDEVNAEGKRTGNKIPVRVFKFSVSYGESE
jgi:hypothetical protein